MADVTNPDPRALAERIINENGDALVGSWDRETFLQIVEERDALARYALDREAECERLRARGQQWERRTRVAVKAARNEKVERTREWIQRAVGTARRDLGPHPDCPRCKGSGVADNAQFRCACRWEGSPSRPLPAPPRSAATGEE